MEKMILDDEKPIEHCFWTRYIFVYVIVIFWYTHLYFGYNTFISHLNQPNQKRQMMQKGNFMDKYIRKRPNDKLDIDMCSVNVF